MSVPQTLIAHCDYDQAMVASRNQGKRVQYNGALYTISYDDYTSQNPPRTIRTIALTLCDENEPDADPEFVAMLKHLRIGPPTT